MEEAHEKKTGNTKKYFQLLKDYILNPIRYEYGSSGLPLGFFHLDTKAYNFEDGDEFIKRLSKN